ncbi:cold-shock protein [Micromonospora sp. NPDC048830]|uniref:cold-shock protein n=1 Tax=Micromonospora sp. NPDC048830 TaxID=3364257 RepID=UPI003711ADA7
MAEGRVVSFDPEEGYGYIAPDHGGPDLFVHHSSIETNGRRTLEQGQRVSFAVESGADGPCAVRVTPVGGDPQEPSVDDSRRVRRARLTVVAVAFALALLVLVVAYTLLAASAGWWLPGWWPWAVGGLIGAAYGAGKLNR